MKNGGEQQAADTQLPFDPEFQKSLLRLLCEDSRFAHAVGEHLEPRYFENDILSWAWSYARRFKETYGAYPGLHTIMQQARTMDPKVRPVYEVTLEQVRQAPPSTGGLYQSANNLGAGSGQGAM